MSLGMSMGMSMGRNWKFGAWFFLLGHGVALSAQANWDYLVGGAARLRPLGAAFYGQLGYGELLWGEPKPGDFRYGYFRPLLKLQTSGVVTRSDLEFQIYPISFFGIEMWQSESFRLTDISTIDCLQSSCQGVLSRTYMRARLFGGYGPFFLGGSTQWASLRVSSSGLSLADESSVLVGAEGGDQLLSHEAFAGVKVTDRESVGLYLYTDRMATTGNHADHESLYLRVARGAWTYTAGAGLYQSSTQARGMTFYGVIVWTGRSSIELR